ncbi:hypothetical protein BGZ81_002447, partial [Podila clonocystis]
ITTRHRSMCAGRIGFNCSVTQSMFVEGDPSLCFDNWDDGTPSVSGGGMYINRTSSIQTNGAILTEVIYGLWHQMSLKTVKSYYHVHVNPKLWKERTVLLGRAILSDPSTSANYGTRQEERHGFLSMSNLAAVLLLSMMTFWLICCTWSAAQMPSRRAPMGSDGPSDLAIAMNHCWDAVMNSATHGRNFEGKPLKVSLHYAGQTGWCSH